ncbi:MAG: DUF3592 domain-containing protein [Phycisphaerae bacterium]|nr:DUF3592 domain-containing protein [Phycisphaerae bacterium]
MNKKGSFFLILFGMVFFGMGMFFFSSAFLQPFMKYKASKSWQEYPCKILVSEIEIHTDSDGDTEIAKIEYGYQINNENYTGDQVYFGYMASNFGGEHKKFIDDYPVGKETVCYVNPQDRQESVLLIKGPPKLMAFFSGIFVVIGFSIAIGGIYSFVKAVKIQASIEEKITSGNYGFVTFNSDGSRTAKVAMMFFVCIFWNSIVGMFVYLIFFEGAFGTGIFIKFFMTPFIIIGAIIIYGLIKAIAQVFGNKFQIKITPGIITPGIPFLIDYRQFGQTDLCSDLSMALICEREERQGGESTIRTIYDDTFMKTQEYDLIAAGQCDGVIPHDMSACKDCTWSLMVKAVIDGKADIDDKYKLPVIPAELLPESYFLQYDNI